MKFLKSLFLILAFNATFYFFDNLNAKKGGMQKLAKLKDKVVDKKKEHKRKKIKKMEGAVSILEKARTKMKLGQEGFTDKDKKLIMEAEKILRSRLRIKKRPPSIMKDIDTYEEYLRFRKEIKEKEESGFGKELDALTKRLEENRIKFNEKLSRLKLAGFSEEGKEIDIRKEALSPKARKKKEKEKEFYKQARERADARKKAKKRVDIYKGYSDEEIAVKKNQEAEKLETEIKKQDAWFALEKSDVAVQMTEYAKKDLQARKLEEAGQDSTDLRKSIQDLKEKIIIKLEKKGFDSDMILKDSKIEIPEEEKRELRWKALESAGIVTKEKKIRDKEKGKMQKKLEMAEKEIAKLEKKLAKHKGKPGEHGEMAEYLNKEIMKIKQEMAGLKTTGLFKKGAIEELLDLDKKIGKAKGTKKEELQKQKDQLENEIKTKIKFSKGLTKEDESLANAKLASDNYELKIVALNEEYKDADPERRIEIEKELIETENSRKIIEDYVGQKIREEENKRNRLFTEEEELKFREDINDELDKKVKDLQDVDNLISEVQNDILKDRGELTKLKKEIRMRIGLWFLEAVVPGLFKEPPQAAEIVIPAPGMEQEEEFIGDTEITAEELQYLKMK